MKPEEIKALRARKAWTTKQLGERIGVSGRTVEGWEQGRRKPSKMAVMVMRGIR